MSFLLLFFWQKFPDMHLHISPSLVAGLVAALDHPFWNARFSSDFSRPRIWNRRRTHSDQWPDCHVWWVPFPSHGGKPPSETSFGFGYERWEMRSYTYSIRMISGENTLDWKNVEDVKLKMWGNDRKRRFDGIWLNHILGWIYGIVPSKLDNNVLDGKGVYSIETWEYSVVLIQPIHIDYIIQVR